MKSKDIYISALKMSIKYYIGQNASENFQMIDNAKETDIWFHVDGGRPSAHIIADIPEELKLDKKERKYIIKQGAVLCKQESKYNSEKNLPIIYAFIKNIQKTDVIGSVHVIQGTTITI